MRSKKTNPRKILFLLSAIGMTLCLVWTLFRYYVPYEFVQTHLEHAFLNPVFREIFRYSYMWLLSCSIILTLAAFLIKDNTPATKSVRFDNYTLALTALSLLTCIAALCTTFIYQGLIMWAPFGLRVLMLLAVAIWLFMSAKNPHFGNLSRGLRCAVTVGICIMALPLLLQSVSAIAYLSSGHILYLHSNALFTFVRYCVPAILLLWYSTEFLIRRKGQS